jgi:hypothetical protein
VNKAYLIYQKEEILKLLKNRYHMEISRASESHSEESEPSFRVDEGRKRVIGIMAAILTSLHMRTADDLFGGHCAVHAPTS